MFSPISPLARRRASVLRSRVGALNATAETWFDGTEASVESRRRQLSAALSVAGNDDDTLSTAFELEAELDRLRRFRAVVNGTAVVEAPPPAWRVWGRLGARGREFVATRVSRFLVENADVLGDPEELDIRATRYADAELAGWPVGDAIAARDGFRAAVAERCASRTASRERVTPRTGKGSLG